MTEPTPISSLISLQSTRVYSWTFIPTTGSQLNFEITRREDNGTLGYKFVCTNGMSFIMDLPVEKLPVITEALEYLKNNLSVITALPTPLPQI